MPGVKIRTSTLSGPKNVVGAPTSRAFIAGITERGRTSAPLSVRSIVEFQNEYGTLQSYSGSMFRAARTFFEEGGSELIVCRAVGTTPTLATLTLVDRTPVTPLSTMRVDAANAGAWGAGVTVQVTTGAVANSVNVAAYLGGDRVTYVTNKTTVADIVTALAGDPYIRATNLAAASTGVTNLPAVSGPTALTGGNDDRATVTAAKVAAALDLATVGWGAGAVAAPGYNATAIGALLIAHSKTNRRVAVLAGDLTSIPSDLSGMSAALVTDGQYGGVFGPWLTIPEGSSVATISPEGYVLGVRARAMNAEGFWQPAAGGRAAARFVTGPYVTYDASVIDTLADGKVNGITRVSGDTVLYGWRSMTANTDQFLLLSSQDVMNTLTGMVEDILQPFVFETIDGTGQLVSRIKGALAGVLQPIEDAGGFAAKFNADGDQINPAWRITVSVKDETTISCSLTVRLSGVAETIEVNVTKAAFNATI